MKGVFIISSRSVVTLTNESSGSCVQRSSYDVLTFLLGIPPNVLTFMLGVVRWSDHVLTFMLGVVSDHVLTFMLGVVSEPRLT